MIVHVATKMEYELVGTFQISDLVTNTAGGLIGDNGTYFEIGVVVLFQAAVFDFQVQLHWQEKCRNYRE